MKKYDFRDRLHEIMARRGYTERMLEEKSNINRRKIAYWKDGRYPTGDILIVLADELDVSTDELLGLCRERELLAAAIADAKLSGCKTCYYGVEYVAGVAVCARQDCQGGGIYPRDKLTCWEWRGCAYRNREDDDIDG